VNQEQLKSKFQGSILGVAIGDSLGCRSLKLRRSKDMLLSDIEPLTYTDDTAMTIGLSESIISNKDVVENKLGNRFKDNYRKEPNRGYANGPIKIFDLVDKSGINYSKAAKMLFGMQGSFGNGSSMRVAPIGLYYYDSDKIYEKAEISSIITHSHPIAIDGAALVAFSVAEALKNTIIDRLKFCDKLINICKTNTMSKKMILVKKFLFSNISDNEVSFEIGKTVLAEESVPFAIYSFLKNPESFIDCILCAIGNGGDGDTLGAMAGGISGAHLGIEAIPHQWISKLENKDYLQKLALLLLHQRQQI
jgi:poly(ADP-ribose) glycohydrolase ARH3